MKLLIITQKVNIDDDNLGFFHAWIEEFAKNIELVSVICLEKGKYNLSQNVTIFSLGKEENNFQFFKKLKYLSRFYTYIWRERNNYDAVFTHMNVEYAVLGAFFWKLLNKKTYLWYVHKKVNFKLKLAEKLVDKIFTASEKSFRLPSKKVIVTGHGIDTDKFKPADYSQKDGKFPPFGRPSEGWKIITAGRIAAVKNLDVLIESCVILKKNNFNFNLKIAGKPVLKEDEIYFEKLKNTIKDKNLEDVIMFVGSISYKSIAEFYQSGDLFVNLSNTGSIDKTVLEAMASGLKALTSNESFYGILPDIFLTSNNPREIAGKITYLSSCGLSYNLREYVVLNHNLSSLIKKLLLFMV